MISVWWIPIAMICTALPCALYIISERQESKRYAQMQDKDRQLLMQQIICLEREVNELRDKAKDQGDKT